MDQSTPVKEAFNRVKEDISNLKLEFLNIKKELNEIQNSISLLTISIDSLKNSQSSLIRQTNRQTDQQTDRPTDIHTNIHSNTQAAIKTDNLENSTIRHINPTEKLLSTHLSTQKYTFQDLKSQNRNISIGNRGVSTDRQTDQQTDRQTQNQVEKPVYNSLNSTNPSQKTLIPQSYEIIEQLDALKKELRLKFKRLTSQEMLIFSSIYQFEDQGFLVDYSLLSSKLNLSESSIRDYIKRIIAKGVILDKEKVNNKRIIVHIPPDFKKLASLDTIIKLRQI